MTDGELGLNTRGLGTYVQIHRRSSEILRVPFQATTVKRIL